MPKKLILSLLVVMTTPLAFADEGPSRFENFKNSVYYTTSNLKSQVDTLLSKADKYEAKKEKLKAAQEILEEIKMREMDLARFGNQLDTGVRVIENDKVFYRYQNFGKLVGGVAALVGTAGNLAFISDVLIEDSNFVGLFSEKTGWPEDSTRGWDPSVAENEVYRTNRHSFMDQMESKLMNEAEDYGAVEGASRSGVSRMTPYGKFVLASSAIAIGGATLLGLSQWLEKPDHEIVTITDNEKTQLEVAYHQLQDQISVLKHNLSKIIDSLQADDPAQESAQGE
ncbi:MAG: hypothetical protein AB7F43_05035 [Bacteriovoracia bacterium]